MERSLPESHERIRWMRDRAGMVAALFGGMACGLVAMAMAILVPGYASDDYAVMNREPIWNFMQETLSRFLITQGRWSYLPLERLLLDFGIIPQKAPVLGGVLMVLCYSLLAAWICRLWRVVDRPVLCFLVGALIVTHPYQAELFTYRSATLGSALGYLPGFAAILWVRMHWRSFLWAVPAFVLSLSSYQLLLNFAASLIIMGLLMEWIRVKSTEDLKAVRDRYAAPMLTIFAGTLIYWFVNRWIIAASELPPESRSSLISVGNLGDQVHWAFSLMQQIFVLKEEVLPVGIKTAFLCLCVLCGVRILSCAWKRVSIWGVGLTIGWIVLAFALLAGALISIPGLMLALDTQWLAPRVLCHAGVIWAGLLVVLWEWGNRAFRRVLLGSCLVILTGFSAICNHIFVDQHRVNARDLALGSAVATYLSSMPESEKVETVVFVVGEQFLRDSKTKFPNINRSAFVDFWGPFGVMQEITGKKYRQPTQAEVTQAMALQPGRPRWPTDGSVLIQEGVGIVFLP